MKNLLRCFGLIAIVGFLATAAPGEPVSASSAAPSGGQELYDQQTMEYSKHIRELLVFDTSDVTMSKLARSEEASQSVDEYGFVMTPDERAEFDIRMAMAEGGRRSALTHAKDLESYAGAFAEPGGARWFIRLVNGTDNERTAIRDRFPYNQDRLEFLESSYTWRELLNAQDQVNSRFSPSFDSGNIDGTAPDPVTNSLAVVLTVDDNTLKQSIREVAEVPVRFQEIDGSSDDSCSSRFNCNSEQRAGVRVKGSGSPDPCSTGFAVRTTTGNEMLLTAGHCWYGVTSGGVYSGTGGYIGFRTSQNALYNNTTADARLIETANSTTENWVYWSDSLKDRTVGQAHSAYGDALPNDTVCIRAHVLQSSSCGYINTVNYFYTSSTCSCRVNAAMIAGYDRTGGNSGGAITSPSGYTAVGIHSGFVGASARFSHIVRVEVELNATVSTTS